MLEHGTPQQGSFEIDPEQGALVVPDAPQLDTRSDLRRDIIDPGIADGATVQGVVAGGRHREKEPLNAIQADIGQNGEVAKRPLPRVVTNGWSSLLQRVVEVDRDIELQRSMIEQLQREQDRDEDEPKDDEQIARNAAGAQAARDAITRTPVQSWDRTHVINQDDEVSPALQQVGDDELRQVPNRE